MKQKHRRISLMSWMTLRHRLRGLARNPEMLMMNPGRFKADINKLDKILLAHMKTLGH